MPSKKKKYNARFPAGRIKKIMQTDEEVGKVAQAVPVIISRTLELFVESLLTKSMQITQSRNAKTLTPSHMKQCILSESRFDFLKDLVKNIPDASAQEDNENNALFEASFNHKIDEDDNRNSSSSDQPSSTTIMANSIVQPANFYTEQSTSRTPVIQYGPKVASSEKIALSLHSKPVDQQQPKLHITLAEQVPSTDNIPPLIPISHNFYQPNTNTEDTLCIDEDYDN